MFFSIYICLGSASQRSINHNRWRRFNTHIEFFRNLRKLGKDKFNMWSVKKCVSSSFKNIYLRFALFKLFDPENSRILASVFKRHLAARFVKCRKKNPKGRQREVQWWQDQNIWQRYIASQRITLISSSSSSQRTCPQEQKSKALKRDVLN